VPLSFSLQVFIYLHTHKLIYTYIIRYILNITAKIKHSVGTETLERVAQRGSGGPIPGNIQEQVGQGSKQPDLVSGVPARCRGVGLDDL